MVVFYVLLNVCILNVLCKQYFSYINTVHMYYHAYIKFNTYVHTVMHTCTYSVYINTYMHIIYIHIYVHCMIIILLL